MIKNKEWEELKNKIFEAVTVHSEHNGGYCDTGEDMEWSCRSECVDMAVVRLKPVLEEVENLITQAEDNMRKRCLEEGYKLGVKSLEKQINDNTLISELYGWKQIVDNSVEVVLDQATQNINNLDKGNEKNKTIC